MIKHIFIVTCSYPDEVGGVNGIFIHNQAVALKKGGFGVSVLFYDFRSLRKKRKMGISHYTLDGVNVYRLAFPCGPIKPFLSMLKNVFACRLYKFAVKKQGLPSFFHAHTHDAGGIALKLSRKYGIRYYVTEHSSSILQNQLSDKERRNAARVYKNAAKVIAVSKRLGESIERIAKCDLEIIPNIVPNYFFEPQSRLPQNKKDSVFSFITAGAFKESKRFDLTLRAFSMALQIRKDLVLYIAGDGKLKNELEDLASSLHLTGSVVFLGMVPNALLREYYSLCDCFVLPSDFETFGVVYIEAMACGLPVIATKCGGPEEFVDRTNGILIDLNNVNQLSRAMLYMYDNKSQFDRRQIINCCKDRFSEEEVVNALKATYSNTEVLE